jgi:hypothetical protein
MNKTQLIAFFLVLAAFLSACSAEQPIVDDPSRDISALTQTAESILVAVTPTITEIPADAATTTPIPTLDRTRPPIHTPTSEAVCDKASAGSPIDVTIPDDTLMEPGQNFSKTWRLRNTGNCTWTRLYSVTFFSSNRMNTFHTHYFSDPVEPGDVVEVSIDMQAPQTPGVYQSNWMLQNADGELFGIGPHGDAPFWVRIEVVSQLPETPTLTPTMTMTPVVHVTGEAKLVHEDQLDLDTGILNPGLGYKPDFRYLFGGSPPYILESMNNTRWIVFGQSRPTFQQCKTVSLADNAISFNSVPVGTYICYRTSDALPGWLLLESESSGEVAIRFLTWFIP